MFDPTKDPFEDESTNCLNSSSGLAPQHSQSTIPKTSWWRPNPVDNMVLARIRKSLLLHLVNKAFPNLGTVLDEVSRLLCDEITRTNAEWNSLSSTCVMFKSSLVLVY